MRDSSGSCNFTIDSVVSKVKSMMPKFHNITEADCDKHCFDSCDYNVFGDEFSQCVNSNVFCSCYRKFTIRNPIVIFFLIVFVLIMLIGSGLLYFYYRRKRRSSINSEINLNSLH